MERCVAVGWEYAAFVVVTHGVAVAVTQFHLKNKIY
jgi:hypothetical protein